MCFRSGCSGTALPFVKWLRLCWTFLYLALAGAHPVWGNTDVLHGWQPAELVGSTSDTPSCHADVISKPIHYRRGSVCHFAHVAQMDSAQKHKRVPDPARDSVGSFLALCSLFVSLCLMQITIPFYHLRQKIMPHFCGRPWHSCAELLCGCCSVHFCCLPWLRVSKLVIGFLESSYSLQWCSAQATKSLWPRNVIAWPLRNYQGSLRRGSSCLSRLLVLGTLSWATMVCE